MRKRNKKFFTSEKRANGGKFGYYVRQERVIKNKNEKKFVANWSCMQIELF